MVSWLEMMFPGSSQMVEHDGEVICRDCVLGEYTTENTIGRVVIDFVKDGGARVETQADEPFETLSFHVY